jgi:hypothetical protein
VHCNLMCAVRDCYHELRLGEIEVVKVVTRNGCCELLVRMNVCDSGHKVLPNCTSLGLAWTRKGELWDLALFRSYAARLAGGGSTGTSAHAEAKSLNGACGAGVCGVCSRACFATCGTHMSTFPRM